METCNVGESDKIWNTIFFYDWASSLTPVANADTQKPNIYTQCMAKIELDIDECQRFLI
jgi:hypothetical protein